MKKIGIGLAVLIALITGALLYLHFNLDSIIKAAIEKYGTQAAQAEVRLSSVKFSITSGEGSLGGLTLDNPKGFSSSKALKLGIISLKLDTGSVTGSGPIVIREIVVSKPEVNFEGNNTGDSNLQALERNLSAGARSGATSGNKSTQKQSRKIIIKNLVIRDGQVDISHPLLKNALTAPLPTIHLTNIGQNGGATPAQVADQVLTSIISSASSIATEALTKNLGGALGGTVSGNAMGTAGGTAGNIGNKVKGLLGR